MADEKEKAQNKKNDGEQDKEQTTGHGKSGGNMGAGKSGTEDLGSEKPSDNETMGSHKPGETKQQE